MRIIIKATLLILTLLIQGCETYGRISSIPLEGQKLVFKDGRSTLMSIKQNTVLVAPELDTVTSGQRGGFVIAVNNGTAQDILFSTDDVAAYSETNNQQTELKVFSYEELVAEENKRLAWAAIAIALQGAAASINATNAGYSHTYGTYSGSAYSSDGVSAHGSGSYSSTTYNSAAAQAAQNAAQADSQMHFAHLAASGRENLRNLSSSILKKETIFSGGWHGGIVKVQLPDVSEEPQEIKLDINVAGEQHAFNFMQEKVKER